MRKDQFSEIYTYVESGFPVLGSTEGHVVTLIGHTLSRKPRRRIRTKTVASAEFVDSLVIVDDNRFPYHRLGWKRKPAREGPARELDSKSGRANATVDAIESLKHFVIPLPEKVFLPAGMAEKVLTRYLANVGLYRPLRLAYENMLKRGGGVAVTRQFVASGSSTKAEALRRYSESSTRSNVFARVLELSLPHFVWVLEICPLRSYTEGTHLCGGEIVIDATSAAWSHDSLLFFRMGNHVVIDGETVSGEGEIADCPQFTHNLGEWTASASAV